MKLKKFLQGKVMGNPYYERLTLNIVFSIIIALFSKVSLGMLIIMFTIYEPTLLFKSMVITIIVDTILYFVIVKSGVEQLKTGLWDRLETTLAVCIDTYKALYYIEVLIFMLAQISVLGFKAFTLMVLSVLIINILNNYIKGKKYEEEKHGLTDYQTDIKPK